jgi:hypothetical protein
MALQGRSDTVYVGSNIPHRYPEMPQTERTALVHLEDPELDLRKCGM